MQIGKAARSNGSHIKSRLKMEPHGVFKEVTKQCTNKDHHQSVGRWQRSGSSWVKEADPLGERNEVPPVVFFFFLLPRLEFFERGVGLAPIGGLVGVGSY